jgi:hypothetical protein
MGKSIKIALTLHQTQSKKDKTDFAQNIFCKGSNRSADKATMLAI